MYKKPFAITLFMTVFIVCLTIASCKKENPDNSNSIVGKWKMTGYIHYDVDVYGTAVPTCVTDDIITFSSTGIVTADDGPTKCSPTDPQTLTGGYSINSNRTQLTFTFNGETNIDSILTLNSTTLKLRQLSNNDLVTYARQP